MDQLIFIVTAGGATGAVYALLALGYVLIFKTTGTLSFAQGAFLLLGGYLGYELASGVFELTFVLAVVGATAAVVVAGWIAQRLIAAPLFNSGPTGVLVASIGLDIALRSAIESRKVWSRGSLSVAPVWQGTVEFAGTTVPRANIAVFLIVVVLFAVIGAWLRWTRWGLFLRASAEDVEAASAQGISVKRNVALVWMIATGLAGLAGILVGVGASTLTQTNFNWAFRALPAAVLGGMGSVPGAVVGGLSIGIIEAATAAYQPAWVGAQFSLVMPYVVMLVVLLVRPQGIFGEAEAARV